MRMGSPLASPPFSDAVVSLPPSSPSSQPIHWRSRVEEGAAAPARAEGAALADADKVRFNPANRRRDAVAEGRSSSLA